MLIPAEWTDDCQGKKDYDGELVSISTRYWPRGGGYFAVKNYPGQPIQTEQNEDRPEIKPSAHSAILLQSKDEEDFTLIEKAFEAETQEEVQRQVEEWTQEQYHMLVRQLESYYKERAQADR